MTSPLRAEVYIIHTKVFPNLTWGTRDPVAFRDSELGLIRLRAFGMFNIRVLQPVLFVNNLVGTQGVYTQKDIEEYLNRVIVSRFNDLMGEKIDTIFNLPSRYNDLSEELKKILETDFTRFGLGISDLFIQSITPPPEVQKAIDDKSRLNVFDDLNQLLKMKAAMAIEGAAQNQGEAGAGLGMGLGMAGPAAAALIADTTCAERRGEVYGIFNTSRMAGVVAGPLLAGVAADMHGVGGAVAVFAVLAAVITLAALLVKDSGETMPI